jgi:ubiquinone/menaquinone biosynthesis C-methylase UbiE
MSHRVCPWWIGYLLASPLRRWMMKPQDVVGPYVRPGYTVLEPGPGMGFFTLPLAEMVGQSGRVIAIDLQPKMIDSLKRRAKKTKLLDRIDARVSTANSLGVNDLQGTVDLTLAFAMLHELPEAHPFFREVAEASKPGALLLIAEPAGHVKPEKFGAEIREAQAAGFKVVDHPTIKRSHAVLMRNVRK